MTVVVATTSSEKDVTVESQSSDNTSVIGMIEDFSSNVADAVEGLGDLVGDVIGETILGGGIPLLAPGTLNAPAPTVDTNIKFMTETELNQQDDIKKN